MQQTTSKSSFVPTLILGSLFVIFGFITWLNGTLIQYLKIACELNDTQSFLIASAFYAAYFFLALPSSWILKITGFKKGMTLGLIIMAMGALLFIPAAKTRTYGLFLTAQFIIGAGLSILQTASNPYVTIVGPIESATRRMSIMGICNKVAGVFGPIILSAYVLADADDLTAKLRILTSEEKISQLNELSLRVILPYSIMAVVLFILGLAILFSPLPSVESEEESVTGERQMEKGNILEYPNLVLGVLALFLYVGVEVIAGDTIGTYGRSLNIPLSETKHFTSFTLAAMVAGYIIGILSIPTFISQTKALMFSAIGGIIFTFCAISTGGYYSIFFIALLGVANAPIWPAIWPLAISGLGKFTKTGSAMLIMAIVGGAILPPLWAKLSSVNFIGHKEAYVILVPCYLFILFYSVKGYKISKW